ncbi:MAG: hydroxyphenylacetyl-CoA thioesterase PaaI [Rhodospirillales bacterium]|nr:hydroxyphenylacetyl-CoA thioesterase PaaI [Rhodospirillales bacterium]
MPDRRTTAEADSQTIAEAAAHAMLRGDRVSRQLGIVLIEAGPGRATLAMTVTEAMLNGFGTCHGGVLFTLADTALSCACNSRNERSVAHHCSIVFLRPARPGERLVAVARESSRHGRIGIYLVSLLDAAGAVAGEFFGHSRLIGGKVVEPAAPADQLDE